VGRQLFWADVLAGRGASGRMFARSWPNGIGGLFGWSLIQQLAKKEPSGAGCGRVRREHRVDGAPRWRHPRNRTHTATRNPTGHRPKRCTLALAAPVEKTLKAPLGNNRARRSPGEHAPHSPGIHALPRAERAVDMCPLKAPPRLPRRWNRR